MVASAFTTEVKQDLQTVSSTLWTTLTHTGILSEETQGEERDGKNQQFYLTSFIKFCMSSVEIQSLSNTREKINPRALRIANR